MGGRYVSSFLLSGEWPLPISGGVVPGDDGRVGGTPPDRQIASNSEDGEGLWPIRLVTGHGPNTGEVTVGELARVCAELAGPLHDDSSTGVPKNAIPPLLKINGMDLNPAQVLRSMAQAVVNPTPEASIRVRMTYMVGEAGGILPKSREQADNGFIWTIKPAPLNATSN